MVDIRVDGKEQGKTPLAAPLELQAGAHKVELTAEGHEPWSGDVQVVIGKTAELVAALKKLPPPVGKISFTLSLKGAKVALDGKPVEVVEGTPLEVSPGAHEIKLTKPEMKDISQKLNVAAGSTVEVTGKWEEANPDDGLGPYVTVGMGVGMIALGSVFASRGGEAAQGAPTTALGDENTDTDAATATAVLYSLGGILVATGVTLFVLGGGGAEAGAEASEGTASSDTSWAVAPYLSGDGGGVTGVLRF